MADKFEIVPKSVSTMADAIERGYVVFGGQQAGKTMARRMASARHVYADESQPSKHWKMIPWREQFEKTGIYPDVE